MTIGIGYFGENCSVLASDMELTGIAKYRGVKDYIASFNGPMGTISAIYAGVEDDMRCIWERMTGKLEDSKGLTVSEVRQLLSDALAAVITDPKSNFQMLVVISNESEDQMFLRVWRKRVSPARDWEIIGADCELTRYLTSLVGSPTLAPYQAVLWATHIVQVAHSFVQHVGQGVRLTIVYPDGQLQYMDGDIFAEKMAIADSHVASMWWYFCNRKVSQEQFDIQFKLFGVKMSALRGEIPLMVRD